MYIIAGIKKHQKILTPKGFTTRPTSGRMRESVFDICQLEIENASFLDLFAGSGAMGLEALSRGAALATFVDNDKKCIQTIIQNLTNLKLSEHGIVYCLNTLKALQLLKKSENQYDIIYCDPPYGKTMIKNRKKITISSEIINEIDNSDLLKSGGLFFLEESATFSLENTSYLSLKLLKIKRFGRSNLFQFVKN